MAKDLTKQFAKLSANRWTQAQKEKPTGGIGFPPKIRGIAQVSSCEIKDSQYGLQLAILVIGKEPDEVVGVTHFLNYGIGGDDDDRVQKAFIRFSQDAQRLGIDVLELDSNEVIDQLNENQSYFTFTTSQPAGSKTIYCNIQKLEENYKDKEEVFLPVTEEVVEVEDNGEIKKKKKKKGKKGKKPKSV